MPNEASSTHLVLIPSYNPGPKVFETVRNALDQWAPVWVVVDGSTDQSVQGLSAMAAAEPGLHVLVLDRIAARAPRCCLGYARRKPWDSPMH